MSYFDSAEKYAGLIGQIECDRFVRDNEINSVKPTGPDIGIDRNVSSKEYPKKSAKIQVKGRS